MADKYLDVAYTDSVRAAQAHYYGAAQAVPPAADHDAFGDAETAFVHARDSFYLGTVGETGWPYIQHRGGKPGFLRVVDPRTLGFADYRGNRQLLSTGNLAKNDRAALFLMDYPGRSRLKIMGRVRVLDAREHPAEVERLAEPAVRRLAERLFFIDVVSFDWNCPKYITPRYGIEEVTQLTESLKRRIAELEALVAGKETP